MLNLHKNEICSCIKAYLLQKIVGHVMFGTCLRLLGLEKSHGVANNSPNYRVSATFFYWSNFDASVEPVELCREKRPALLSTRWWCALCGEHHYSQSWTVSRIKAKYQLGKKDCCRSNGYNDTQFCQALSWRLSLVNDNIKHKVEEKQL